MGETPFDIKYRRLALENRYSKIGRFPGKHLSDSLTDYKSDLVNHATIYLPLITFFAVGYSYLSEYIYLRGFGFEQFMDLSSPRILYYGVDKLSRVILVLASAFLLYWLTFQFKYSLFSSRRYWRFANTSLFLIWVAEPIALPVVAQDWPHTILIEFLFIILITIQLVIVAFRAKYIIALALSGSKITDVKLSQIFSKIINRSYMKLVRTRAEIIKFGDSKYFYTTATKIFMAITLLASAVFMPILDVRTILVRNDVWTLVRAYDNELLLVTVNGDQVKRRIVRRDEIGSFKIIHRPGDWIDRYGTMGGSRQND